MTDKEKLKALADVFDCDASELTPNTALDELEWDSMAKLSVIALVKNKFNKKLLGVEVHSFKTVGDIMAVMG